MRLPFLHLLSLSSLIPLTAALQTIYFGTLGGAGANYYFTFFSDSDPCSDGVILNYLLVGFRGCDEPFTMLGHENLTFTGCPPTDNYSGLPTGVSDNGAPALTCQPASNPPGGPYGLYANCPYPPANPNDHIGGVNLLEYCS